MQETKPVTCHEKVVCIYTGILPSLEYYWLMAIIKTLLK